MNEKIKNELGYDRYTLSGQDDLHTIAKELTKSGCDEDTVLKVMLELKNGRSLLSKAIGRFYFGG